MRSEYTWSLFRSSTLESVFEFVCSFLLRSFFIKKRRSLWKDTEGRASRQMQRPLASLVNSSSATQFRKFFIGGLSWTTTEGFTSFIYLVSVF